MCRRLEPELMEDDAQVRAYAEADFEDAHSNFISLFQENRNGKDIDGYVLDLGCGPGDITIRFARAYQNSVVHGIDGSEVMLRYSKKFLEKSLDVKDRVEFFYGRFPEVSSLSMKYDVIISNSVLHHLPNPQVLWDTVKKFAVCKAPIFIMDLMRPKTTTEAEVFVEMYAADEPEILRRDFFNSLQAAFEVGEIEAQLEEAKLEHLSVKVVSDRHLIISGNMI